MTFLHAPLAACFALSLLACGPDAATDSTDPAATPATVATVSTTAAPPAGPYRFDAPVARFEMPEALREISALTVLPGDQLGAVQDEDGDLYVLSAETGEVVRVVPFGPPGDYEGIELVGDRLFVLRSDGAIFELDGWAGDRARATVTETGLGADACDAEGLGAEGQRLLIACKEEDGDDLAPVYAFDLATLSLAAQPTFQITRDVVPGNDKKLRPSALAVHPVTGHTVVLSSKSETLIALEASGAVAGVWDLEAANFEQPEGLTFLPNGDVFVSSEGRDGPAVIVRFAYQPTL